MRFNRDVRKCVLFLGFPDYSAGDNGLTVVGTAFLLSYKQVGYLITARHVARDLGDTGFVARINKRDGTSGNVEADRAVWFTHPDPTVDVALTQFMIDPKYGFDAMYMDESLLLSAEQEHVDNVELGDLCYTVGMFRVLAGKQRNLPVVHTGNLARLAGEEKIPLRDKDSPTGSIDIDGYLVESQSLSGLSGAPVFIRQSMGITLTGGSTATSTDITQHNFLTYQDKVLLLGLWQAAWEAPAGEVLALDRGGKEMTVPVGMGVVVPTARIIEVLEMSEVKAFRDEVYKRRGQAQGASPQSVGGGDAASPQSSVVNPTHREDFTRLLGAAVKAPKPTE